MIHPLIGWMALCGLALVAFMTWQDLLHAATPPPDDGPPPPPVPWVRYFLQAGFLGLLFLAVVILSFGYSRP